MDARVSNLSPCQPLTPLSSPRFNPPQTPTGLLWSAERCSTTCESLAAGSFAVAVGPLLTSRSRRLINIPSRVKNGQVILLVSVLLCAAACTRQEVGREEVVIPPTREKQQEIVNRAVTAICIEIASQYVTQKGAIFPADIRTTERLEAYLKGMYRNSTHELRVAVVNLGLYGRDFTQSGADVGPYLREGIRRHAVDANGKPLKLDGDKIGRIIAGAEAEVAAAAEKKVVEHPKRTNAEPSIAIIVTDFIRRNALLLVGALAFTNLCSLSLLVIQKSRTRRTASPASPVERIAQAIEPVKVAPAVGLAARRSGTGAPVTTRPATARSDRDSAVSVNGADMGQWLVVSASVPGKLHTDNIPPVPCQDSHLYRDLGEGWGVAVVCDGAGSKEHSHLGSRFVAERAIKHFEEIVKEKGWQSQSMLPEREQWHELSKKAFAKIRSELEEYARREHNVDSGSLSCTVIVVVHSPVGILASHIGDGRAAFCNANNEWKAVITPHKGEEANQTVFLTSVDWQRPDGYIESTVFRERPLAFALLSDGCESHSFEVNIFDKVENKYTDPNRPYPGFFQPLVATLRDLRRNSMPGDQIGAMWRSFIESGNERIREEGDDKTLILGVLVD